MNNFRNSYFIKLKTSKQYMKIIYYVGCYIYIIFLYNLPKESKPRK